MQTSLNGMKFIACREALVTRAYVDGEHMDGTPKYSLGFGSQTDEPKEGQTISIEDAFARLKSDIAARDVTIGRAIKVPIVQNQWDATASLFYQSGSTALRTVADLFNQGQAVFAMIAFAQFNLDKGAPSVGLSKRRIREMIMGIDNWYGDLSQIPFFEGNPHVVERKWMPFPESI